MPCARCDHPCPPYLSSSSRIGFSAGFSAGLRTSNSSFSPSTDSTMSLHASHSEERETWPQRKLALLLCSLPSGRRTGHLSGGCNSFFSLNGVVSTSDSSVSEPRLLPIVEVRKEKLLGTDRMNCHWTKSEFTSPETDPESWATEPRPAAS